MGAAAARLNVNAWQPVQTLKDRFPDLARHFIFEYYPWYGVGPFRHWDQDGHWPPADLASNYVPLLGAYDSASARVMEQHARWMKDAGAGAINVSWWGKDSDTDRLNSFNEWHEGHQFEPMKNDDAIAEEHASRHYHNAADGEYRLKALSSLLATVE